LSQLLALSDRCRSPALAEYGVGSNDATQIITNVVVAFGDVRCWGFRLRKKAIHTDHSSDTACHGYNPDEATDARQKLLGYNSTDGNSINTEMTEPTKSPIGRTLES